MIGIVDYGMGNRRSVEKAFEHVGAEARLAADHGVLRAADGLPDPATFYHVHTFVPHPADTSDVLGLAEYGSEFVSVVERGSVYGAQFHPEKSSTHGLALLRNFTAICSRVAA